MRSIGELQYQLSESALKKAEAELSIAKLNVERCNILAPYNGKVMDVYTNVFTSIEQRQPLMDIVGDGLLEAAVVVPSKWLKWLKKGHPVKIIIDETGEVLDKCVSNSLSFSLNGSFLDKIKYPCSPFCGEKIGTHSKY